MLPNLYHVLHCSIKPMNALYQYVILLFLQGMPGAPGMKMYSREDLMNQNFGGDEDADEDDEDEADFPKNLVNTNLFYSY